jgi:hypothetical protein
MPVTSMKQILGSELGMSEVKYQLRRVLSQGFDMQIQDADWPEVQALAARQAGD